MEPALAIEVRHASATTCAARLSAADGTLFEGAYSLWLRELLRALPSRQLRVLRAEDLKRDPATAARETLAFLGLPAHPAVEKADAAARPVAAQQDANADTSLGDSFYGLFNAELQHLMDGHEQFARHRVPN